MKRKSTAFGSFREWSDPTLLFVAFLIGWEVFTRVFKVSTYVLPSASRTTSYLILNAGGFVHDSLRTFGVSFLGFVMANAASLALAVWFVRVRWAERSVLPLLTALKALPAVAIVPTLTLWLGFGLGTKVMASAYLAFLPMVLAAVVAFRRVRPEDEDLFKLSGATWLDGFWHLRMPSALPHLFAAARVSAPLAALGAVLGEIYTSNSGLGYRMTVASYTADAEQLYATIVCMGVVAMAMLGAVAVTQRLFKLKYRHL